MEPYTIDFLHDGKYVPSIKILHKLSKSSNEGVRCLVALNKHTPIDILNRLSEGASAEVRYCVYWNVHVSKGILTKFTNDPCARIRKYSI